MTSETRRVLEPLLSLRSLTPDDAGCQRFVSSRLSAAGFDCGPMSRGYAPDRVDNLLALRRGPSPGPTLLFAGHTDVVPPGPLSAWTSDPFVPTVRDSRLFARGAADMKASVAAMVVAIEEFVAARPAHGGTIGLVLTSDEEGPAVDGTVRVVEALLARGERFDACIVGEPTSVERLGDTVKNGRRGSLSGRLVVLGVQGHVAYPERARNAIHLLAAPLAEMAAERWDAGNADFPPTSFQASNLAAGTGAGNVVPGEATLDFNFRFSTVSTPEALKRRVEAILDRHGVERSIDWTLGAEPFLTPPGRLSETLAAAILAETGVRPTLSTTGGTSDGRFLKRVCAEVLEFGPVNATIHQANESIALADLEPLKNIYRRVLEEWLP